MKTGTLLILSALIIAGCKQSSTLAKPEVIAVIEKFDMAWKAKLPETVDSVLSPSYIYFTQSGSSFSRKNVVATANSPQYTLERVDRRIFDVNITGNTAVVNTVWTAKGKYVDHEFDDQQRCSITIVKEDGKVHILSEHCTPIR